jgi:ABC-2 type transport system ATP-binding protein
MRARLEGPALAGGADAVITTTSLTKRYQKLIALRDLTVTIAAGGVTALLGPNGAGKSTLLKLCVGFETPSAGRLTVCGIDPVRDRRAAVGSIGYVPQSPGLYRDTSVEDHLAIAQAIRPGFDGKHAREGLQALGIRLRASPAQLSGGQQAQVCLAVALGTRAPLLLLDEPLASLDPLARREFLAVIRESARSGDVTIVLSSHVISEIEEVADRILVLGDGLVLYHETVVASIAGHRVLDDGDALHGAEIVGRFPGRRDEKHVLVRSSDASLGRAGSLEEVVMGYLAAGRTGTPTDWSAT